MKHRRWIRPALTAISLAGGIVGGFLLAVGLWTLAVDQDPQSEAGAVGLIWLFFLFTAPFVTLIIRALLVRMVFGRS